MDAVLIYVERGGQDRVAKVFLGGVVFDVTGKVMRMGMMTAKRLVSGDRADLIRQSFSG